MTTDQRIDRLKLEMIELSKKLDQLLEEQVQILAVFTRLDQNMDTRAECLLANTINDLTDDG